MGISVDIHRKIGDFQLRMRFEDPSDRIGILGASGSGKSMTLRAIAGILTPDEGRIELDGRVLFDSRQHINITPQKRRVGYLFQNYALFPRMTAAENIAAGVQGNRKEKARKVAEMVRCFHLAGLEDRLPAQLSGGQQQRVALARIMAYQPDIILLDEPFSALDSYLKDRLQEELAEMLREYAGTVILVSHSRDEIYRFSRRLIVVDEGKAISHGDTREIFASPQTKAAAVLTGCKNISAVRQKDDHTLYAQDWGIELHLKDQVPPGTHYIGYRAHQFKPVWGEREDNCIRFSLSGRAELQFEKIFYSFPEKNEGGRKSKLTWAVQRSCWSTLEEKGMPDYLRFFEKDIMFLK